MIEGIKHNFQTTVWDYYDHSGRHDLPWRQAEPDGAYDPYKITVSELMLQQTQVSRVIPKYVEFLESFPTLDKLAQASLGEVLRVWNGLGYNRRAKYLRLAAQQLALERGGDFPDNVSELVKLPGIGPNTAGAIAAYAFNRPVIFVETNIRTVFIHQFFNDRSDVADSEINPLVESTLEAEHPREWYWALMDYGSHLKQTVGNLNKLSKHYTKQSAFHGSRRQIRGAVIRLLGSGPRTETELRQRIPDERLESVLSGLVNENLIRFQDGSYLL